MVEVTPWIVVTVLLLSCSLAIAADHGTTDTESTADTEKTCAVRATYELKFSSDGKKIEVFNEDGVLISRLGIAELAGLNKNPYRVVDSDCSSLRDRHLLSLIDASSKASRKNKALFTDSLGYKWYSFEGERLPYLSARLFCQSKGLNLPTKEHVEKVKTDIEEQARVSDKMKSSFWASPAINERNSAYYYMVNDRYVKVDVDVYNNDARSRVRCVER